MLELILLSVLGPAAATSWCAIPMKKISAMGNANTNKGGWTSHEDMEKKMKEAVKISMLEMAPTFAEELSKVALQKLNDQLQLAIKGGDILKLVSDEEIQREAVRRQIATTDRTKETEFTMTLRGLKKRKQGSKRKREDGGDGKEGETQEEDEEGGKEKRWDDDGIAHLKSEFIDHYGGTKEWDEAPRLRHTPKTRKIEACVSRGERERLMGSNKNICGRWLEEEECNLHNCRHEHFMRRRS